MNMDIKKEFTSPQLYLIALVLGIIAIMMVKFSHSLTPIAVILIWPAFISGANAVRQVARYGLGTGTSSIGYWGTAVGATMAFTSQFINPAYNFASPYFEIFGALIVGAVTGICAQKIIKMKIPVMISASAVLASSTAIIAMFFLAMLTEYSAQVSTLDAYITYPLIYIAITLAILHPFNGSMGAGENQKRTLRLSAVEASVTTGLFGLIALLFSEALFFTGISVIIVSTTGFFIFVKRWFAAAKEDTYEVAWTGYPPAEH
jgi:tetrahydromethanopterin S-methyltransferase subunit C